MNKQKIVIVGGGLSGLALAYFLSKKNFQTTILEASSRLGGRIQTIKGERETPLELGATWFTEQHTHLKELLDELNLEIFPQYTDGTSLFQRNTLDTVQEFVVPKSESSSYRIAGGTYSLIDALNKSIKSTTDIQINQKVKNISEVEDRLVITTTTNKTFGADKVFLCVPPQLVGSSIQFSPALPNRITNLLPQVQTWMSGSIKFVIEYESAFWREKGYSGLLYSNVGIVTEMYDHSNVEFTKYGFTGFLHPNAATYSFEQRREQVLFQLVQLFGKEALKPVTYQDKMWTDNYVLGENPVIWQRHYNNGHIELRKSFYNNKLFFVSTETDTEFPGYMEGAIRSAKANYNTLEKCNV